MPNLHLTKRAIEAIEPTVSTELYWDISTKGFGLRVSPGGTKAFIVQFRDGAKSVRKTLGTFPTMALDRAKRAAADVLAANRLGEELPLRKSGGPPFSTVLDAFIANAKAKLAPRTAEDYEGRITQYIRPAFGHRKVGQITRMDVEKFHQGFADRPSQGNHVLTILVAALSYAVKPMGVLKIQDHPALGITKYRENKRTRYLTLDEVKAFGKALKELEDARTVSPWAAAALRLLMLTGARSGEILGLKWPYVDLAGAALNLPTSKTGAKQIKLSDHAVQVLRDVPRIEGVDWVIAGRRHGEAMTSLQRPFGSVLAAARITGLRIHDLRHSAASIATSGGVGLSVVGALLGQSQAWTTERYSHVHDQAERHAADVIGQAVGRYLNVVPMKRTRTK